MCTLILAWRVFEGTPVVVAANRDEAAARPSSPPRRWETADIAFVAPRDETAGGTWIGYNESGLFVGIANRWTDEELLGSRSRGRLVADALGSEDVDAAVSMVTEATRADDYAGFSLLLADSREAILIEWDGTLQLTPLRPGVHVLTNAGFDDAFRTLDERGESARRQAEASHELRKALQPTELSSRESWLERATSILGSHELGICVHGDGYGTRSASLIALSNPGDATFRFADGPPCTSAFERVEGQS